MRPSRQFNPQLIYHKSTVSIVMLYKQKTQKINSKNMTRLNYKQPEEQIF